MDTGDSTGRWALRGDPALLTEAATALRVARAEQIFGDRFPGEYVMSGVARLLEAIASEMREKDTLGHGVVSAATDMSAHILRYLPELGEATSRRDGAAGADRARTSPRNP
jgi:hypothetical protein